MSEINEDNCVLDEKELMCVKSMLSHVSDYFKIHKSFGEKLFQKINKLNDMAKDKTNELR